MAEIISNIGEFLGEIKDFIVNFASLFTKFASYIPKPFSTIILSVLGILVIILVLRSVGK